jgi:D-alanine-D-alanine ligase
MLSLTRDINPELPGGMSENIRTWARKTFDHLGASGAPRIDFLSNSKTGEVWLNEVNPLPGSFAYFLWEAATPSVAFTDLIEHFIKEGEDLHRRSRLPDDPTPTDARLFKR